MSSSALSCGTGLRGLAPGTCSARPARAAQPRPLARVVPGLTGRASHHQPSLVRGAQPDNQQGGSSALCKGLHRKTCPLLARAG